MSLGKDTKKVVEQAMRDTIENSGPEVRQDAEVKNIKRQLSGRVRGWFSIFQPKEDVRWKDAIMAIAMTMVDETVNTGMLNKRIAAVEEKLANNETVPARERIALAGYRAAKDEIMRGGGDVERAETPRDPVADFLDRTGRRTGRTSETGQESRPTTAVTR